MILAEIASSRKRFVWLIGLVTSTVILCAVTRPAPSEHRLRRSFSKIGRCADHHHLIRPSI
jgi:hypothetical protein